MHKIFIYGSLKRSFHNHERMLRAGYCEIIGESRTEARDFAMVNIDGHYPAAFRMAMVPLHELHGEVYQVDDAVLRFLDQLEGHPNFYRREQVGIVDHGSCWVYLIDPAFLDSEATRRVPSGRWTHEDAYDVPLDYVA